MALRVSLLIIGCIIILLIYVFSRRALLREQPYARGLSVGALWNRLLYRMRRSDRTESVSSDPVNVPVAPVLDHEELDKLESIIPQRGTEDIPNEDAPVIFELGSEQIAPSGEQLFIPLTIMGRDDTLLNGEAIAQAAQTAGLVLKDDGLYRFQVRDAQGYQQVLLGLANIIEPGIFSSDSLAQLQTPGLVLYLHLPAPIEAREAFDCLIDIGHKLEELLDAELCDETRSVLTKQTIGHLKEKVEAFRFKQKMTSLQRR